MHLALLHSCHMTAGRASWGRRVLWSRRHVACGWGGRLPTRPRAQASSSPEGGGQQFSGGGDNGQQREQPQLPDWVAKRIAEYDSNIAEARELLRSERESQAKFAEEIREMQVDSPGWVVNVLQGLLNWQVKLLKMTDDKIQEREREREAFVQDLLKLAAMEEGQPVPRNASAAAEANLTPEQLRTLERPSTLAGVLLLQNLALTALTVWLGSVILDARYDRLLVWPADLLAGAEKWAAWTVPYVGATLLAATVAPGLFSHRPLRISNMNPRFFAELPLGLIPVLALGAGGTQALVFQGMWLDAALNFFRGSSGALMATDPGLVDDVVRSNLGSIVAASRGAALLSAPLAVLTVAGMEAGLWTMYIKAEGLDIKAEGLVIGEDSVSFAAAIEDPLPDLWKEYQEDSRPMPDAELALTAARVFAGSAYLSVETLVGGSLWFAIGTCSLGVLVAALVARRQGAQAAAGGGAGS